MHEMHHQILDQGIDIAYKEAYRESQNQPGGFADAVGARKGQ